MKRRVHVVWQLTRIERAAAIAVLLALAVAVPVLAAYLGPDRSYTYTETELEKVRDESKDKWTLTNDNPPPGYQDTCISNSSCDAIPNITWQQANCGWVADNASCELGYTWVETTITKTGTHPAATVSGSVTCGTNGANGWCLNSATLNITGNEPLAGENITGIEGTLDGTPFFCGGNTCAVPAPNGQSDAEFWALSSWGDSSLKGSATLKLDLDLPTLDGLVSGTPGNGGWYISDVTLTADASDATSGLDFAQVRVDGGGWINNSATLSTDGQYSVEFRAQDMAGQSVSVPASDVWVDATPPDVSLTPSGTAGLSGWYVSDVDVTLTASDATSGLSASQLRVNGGGWQAVGGVTLGEGVYSIDAEALDVAGNYNATSLDVKVDTTAPALSVTESGAAGSHGWYTSPSVTVNASATDATSGVASIQMQTDGAGYASTNSQTVSGEGAHSVDTTASDAAGNSSSDSRVIRIDSVSPTLSLTSHSPGSVPDESGWVTVTGAVSDATSGPSKVQFSSDGGGSWDTVNVDGGGGFDIGWDSTSVRNGEVTLRVRPVDEAGNVGATTSFTIYVKNDKPYVSLPAGCVAVWDAYAIDAGGGSNPLDGLSVTVSDPQGRWPARDYSFSSVPESWSWDRQFGDGTAAPPGEYDMTVTARDTVGNTTARTGCISIPDPEAAAAGTTPDTETETTDPLDEDDSPTGGTPPDATGHAPAPPNLPSLQKAMADPAGPAVTTKIAAPESGARQAEAERLALATAANAPAWGDAALFLAAAATAYVLSRKQEREAEEAARLAELERRAEMRAMERQAGKVLVADLTDEQVMAQVIAAGGDPNMSIEQARAITHNARLKQGIYSPTGADLIAAQKLAAGEKKIGGGEYIVKPGDNWFSIALAVYGDQRMAGQLMEANGITDAKSASEANFLQPGQKIKLPMVGQSQAANPFFSQSVWRGAEVLTARATGGDVDAVLMAHAEEDIQSWLDGKISTEALAKKLPGVDLEQLRRAGATPADILADYSRTLALLEAMVNSERMYQILRDGDPDPDWIREVEARMASYREMVRSGDITLEELQKLVEATISVNLQSNLRTAQLQSAGQDVAAVGKALEAVYAAHGAEPPWQGTTFENYQAMLILDQLETIQNKQSLLGNEDPNIQHLQEIRSQSEQLKLGLLAGTISAEAVTSLAGEQIERMFSRELDQVWAETEGLSDAERGEALEQVFDQYGLATPWVEGKFEAFIAEQREQVRAERSNYAWGARYQGLADNWEEIESSWMREIHPQEIMYANYRPWGESYSNRTPYSPYSAEYWQGREYPLPTFPQDFSNFVRNDLIPFGEALLNWARGHIVEPLIDDPWAALKSGVQTFALLVPFIGAILLAPNNYQTAGQAWENRNEILLPALLGFNERLVDISEEHSFIGDPKEWFIALARNPSHVIDAGGDILNSLLETSAEISDGIQSYNPLRMSIVQGLQTFADETCSAFSTQALENICTFIPYFTSGLIANPTTTTLDVTNALVIYPFEGLLEIGANIISLETPRDLFQAIGEDGLTDGFRHFLGDQLEFLLDEQVSSFLIIGAFLAIAAAMAAAGVPALVTSAVMGGAIAGPVALEASHVGQAVANAPDAEAVQRLALDRNLRAFVVTSTVLLALVIGHGIKLSSELTAVRDSLPQEMRVEIDRFSWYEQQQYYELLHHFSSKSSTALSQYPVESQITFLSFVREHRVSPTVANQFLRLIQDRNLGQIDLVSGLRTYLLGREMGAQIWIAGRLADTAQEMSIRRQAYEQFEQIALERGILIRETSGTLRKVSETQYQALQAIIAESYGIDFYQVKISTGGSEVDFFIDGEIWSSWSLQKRELVKANLREIFRVENVDVYQEISPHNIPPGSVGFGPEGVTFADFAVPFQGRAENLRVIHTYIRSYYSEDPRISSHALEVHGSEASLEILQALILDGRNTATRFLSDITMAEVLMDTLYRNASGIESWLQNPTSSSYILKSDLLVPFDGWSATQGYFSGEAQVTIILKTDRNGNFYLVTMYPEP